MNRIAQNLYGLNPILSEEDAFFSSFALKLSEFEENTKALKFIKKSTKPQLLIFGEMGNGKSTTGNMLIRNLCQTNNQKPLQS